MGVACCKNNSAIKVYDKYYQDPRTSKSLNGTYSKVKIESVTFDMTRGDYQHNNSIYNEVQNFSMNNGIQQNAFQLQQNNHRKSSMGKTESPLTQQKLKHFNTVGSVQIPVHQSAMKRPSIQNVNPILEEVKLSSESTKNLDPPQFKQPYHNKLGMIRMGTIGVNRLNKFDQKLQLNTNNDAQSYYSSQSQFILGSLYDKQSVAGGSQTVNEGGVGLDRINNMINFQQRNQSPQQRSPGGGSNPTSGELDLIAPVYSPAFAHQRTEIFKDRKQKVNTIFNERMIIQVIAEKQKNQTAESKSVVS